MCSPTSHSPTRYRHQQRGFTLVELVMVIVIMGVIGGIVAVFMKNPIDAYFATARRAALTDESDTVMRRMGRDIRKALPNSIRTPSAAAGQCLEFIPTKNGGRYRADLDSVGGGDMLDFTLADTSFDVFGDMGTIALPVDQRTVAGDFVAVYNLGIAGADAYALDTIALIKSVSAGATTSNLSITGDTTNIASTTGKQFPLASGANRFHIIPKDERVVSYVCSAGKLYRTANATSFSSSCPTSGSVIATNVGTCLFDYSGSDLARNAMVRIVLQLNDSTGTETVNLQQEIHINNTP
jgi:MSHA biogenesis protein MshO